MNSNHLDIVILGLSISSSWGNGHATTYRGLIRELALRGHRIIFLERDKPWYANNRDFESDGSFELAFYDSLDDLHERFGARVRGADFVIVGSYVPEGAALGRWVVNAAEGATAFYDIDTPVTLAQLERGECDYLDPALIARYDRYMSFSGGPTLRYIEEAYGAPKAVPLYCSVDPRHYEPRPQEARWDLGYLGTYSLDRQPPLQKMLVEPARQWREGSFVVAGPQYPEEIEWPENVHRIDHLPPAEHCDFYNQQRFTLNITRADMKKAGWSPSVRLFEAAACATPIISDWWEGLDEFFTPGVEIFISNGSEDTLEHLMQLPNDARREVGEAARRRVLANHTAGRRAQELEQHIHSALAERGRSVAAL